MGDLDLRDRAQALEILNVRNLPEVMLYGLAALVAIRVPPARTGESEQCCRSNLKHSSRIPVGIPSDGTPRRNLRGSR